ncbi:hypothetical protein GSF70_11625 [Flavobacteriaceae bacterium W22]|uniref:tetratricopeptide repeat protein n=1 Tax=Chryseobacterium binzhouense TaxID=2593646 RepID=UPI00136922FE|nr:hypothetical protein [Chryseobacterium binzhouense]MXS71865.1 hypothetical protein [Flavobacteriaceae bacterium W22]
MKKIILIFYLFISQCIFCQNVFKSQKKIYLAEYYIHLKNDQKALDYYLEAVHLNPKTNSYDYLKAASLAFKLKKNETAKELITKSITKQLAPLDFIRDFKSLRPFKDFKEMKDVLSDYDSLENQYYRELKNPAAYMEIQRLIAKDQLIRQENKVFGELAKKIDSANITRLIELTGKYGWEDRAWLLLWHHRGRSQDNEFVWNFFIPFIKKEIEKDNVNKDFFVEFEEFDNATENLPNKSNKGAIYTIGGLGSVGYNHYIDIQNLDKRRKLVGLPPLYFEHLMYGTELPKDYEYDLRNLLSDLENL